MNKFLFAFLLLYCKLFTAPSFISTSDNSRTGSKLTPGRAHPVFAPFLTPRTLPHTDVGRKLADFARKKCRGASIYGHQQIGISPHSLGNREATGLSQNTTKRQVFVSVQSGLLLIDSEGPSVSVKTFSFHGPGILIWVHPRLIDFSVVTTLGRESSPLSVKIAGNPSLEEPKLKIAVGIMLALKK